MTFTLGDLCLHTDGTLRKVIGYNASGLVVTVGAHDGRRPTVYTDDPADLVPVVEPLPEPVIPVVINTIAAARTLRGLTQRQLAARAQVTTQYISIIEQNRCWPSASLLAVIERVLNVELRGQP